MPRVAPRTAGVQNIRMQDLTTGPLSRHLLKTAGYMLVMMVFQTLYFLVDLYWVGHLGTAAVAAVSVAGNLMFIVLALTQMLGVGTTTLIAHAIGRRDPEDATRAFNQAQVLALVAGALFALAAVLLRGAYVRSQSPDPGTAALTTSYLAWFIPAMALQFPMVAMGAALRGTGNFRTGTIVSTATIVLNMALAPVLIFGWGTGRAFGAAGAAMATLASIVAGLVWFAIHFRRDSVLRFARDHLRPRLALWKRLLGIGMPAGFEFAMMAMYLFIVYGVTRPFGAAAQAGFGIGMRIIQAGFMPVVALGFAAAPVAGQNYGARQAARVRATFRDAAVMAAGAMLLFAVACQAAPAALVGFFTHDVAVVRVGAEYLRIISWNYVASGIVFVSASMFQAMGNTLPSLASSAVRIVVVAIPVLVLARAPGFQLTTIWYLSVASVYIQLGVSLWLLRGEFAKRLTFEAAG